MTSFVPWKRQKKSESVPNREQIDWLVEQAQQDKRERNQLLRKYKPFIIKVTSKVCKQYIDISRDEYSVALEGFNEAIDHYQPVQGSHFLSFSEMVIRRRVIDYIRKEIRQTKSIFLEPERHHEDEFVESQAQTNASLIHYEQEQERMHRKEEILEYQKLLQSFGISFTDLVECCPKHIDARENAKQIAFSIADRSQLVEYLLQRKQLPMKHLMKYVHCSRKTIERNRKYIIAMVLIYTGGFKSLRDYIEPESIPNRKGGSL